MGGRSFVIRGIHYGPWRPGTGPNKTYPYPSLKDIAADFDVIRGTGANTVLIYDPPAEVLDLAAADGLRVIYLFNLDWWAVGGPRQQSVATEIVSRVQTLRSKPALLAYVLGNEVGGDVLQTRGDNVIVEGLHGLYTAIKAADPDHPISHANWPPARRLDLSFLDFISFNVYPLWPPEVVAAGFGPYIRNVLEPLAGNKPLLISEFGANTIEAGEEEQARLIEQSWRALLDAGAAGGVVFEFADEWWKNYNNPAHPGDLWTRVDAPDDELRHDPDPEENYGLVQGDRTPKAALNTVRVMFSSEEEQTTARRYGMAGLFLVVLTAAGSWLWARQRVRQTRVRLVRH